MLDKFRARVLGHTRTEISDDEKDSLGSDDPAKSSKRVDQIVSENQQQYFTHYQPKSLKKQNKEQKKFSLTRNPSQESPDASYKKMPNKDTLRENLRQRNSVKKQRIMDEFSGH